MGESVYEFLLAHKILIHCICFVLIFIFVLICAYIAFRNYKRLPYCSLAKRCLIFFPPCILFGCGITALGVLGKSLYTDYIDSSDTVTQVEQTRPTGVDPIFVIMFTGVMLIFALGFKSDYWDHRIERKIRQDEEVWTRNEIRYHSTYLKDSIIVLVFIFIVGILFSIISANIIPSIFAFFAILLLLAHAINQYKSWSLQYTDDTIILSLSNGRKETIPLSDIVSVNESIENTFISKGTVYRIVTIKYKTKWGKHDLIQTEKLDFRYQIGINRFLDFFFNNRD